MYFFSDERLGIPMLPVPGTKHRALLLIVWHGNHPVLERLALHSDKYLDCEGGTHHVESPYKEELFAPLVVSFVLHSACAGYLWDIRSKIRKEIVLQQPERPLSGT